MYTILGHKAKLEKRKYLNKRTAIGFYDPDDDSCITIATVNLPDVQMSEDEVAIKNYSENEGIMEEMMEQNIISAPLRYERTGFVTVPICKILV